MDYPSRSSYDSNDSGNSRASLDLYSQITPPVDFGGLVTSMLDGPLVFEHVSPDQSTPFWVGHTDAAHDRINVSGLTPLPPTGSVDPYSSTMGEAMSTTIMDIPDEERPSDRSDKPRCWDHGCNGKQFSSRSNLMRHIKERNGSQERSTCPLCKAFFTRNSARDTHLANQSCNRIRRYSNGRPRPSRLATLSNPGYASAAVATAAAAAGSQSVTAVQWQTIDWDTNHATTSG
ncbi:hypothetical protein F4778DRAFT_488313 [Xylariomycetidae sp. FL2044]|nr:hypothetical protein F4778DRAFT_488313 [Xylariomycetidae sp. FL2044]